MQGPRRYLLFWFRDKLVNGETFSGHVQVIPCATNTIMAPDSAVANDPIETFLLNTRLKTQDTDMCEFEPKCKKLWACNAAAKAKMIANPKPLTKMR